MPAASDAARRPARRCIGLMSGTSCDAIDAVLLELDHRPPRLLATHSRPLPAELRRRLLRLNDRPRVALSTLGRLDHALGAEFAAAALALMGEAGIGADRISAIGSHGQTIWHRPGDGVTIQIGNPALIAHRTGITTVADFRRADVVRGGQGAPLVPLFHRLLFASRAPLCVVNIGGIANLTAIARDGSLLGFDTGPGNALMDAWCERHLHRPFDADGRWAAAGTVDGALLQDLLCDPFFALPPPRSTGRDHFGMPWLEAALAGRSLPPQDVQRTLLELTACSIAQAVRRHAPGARCVAVCGGGARNPLLMARLAALCPAPVCTTDALGFAGRWMEAAAFAWLALLAIDRVPAGAACVTGAAGDAVLGAIYPA